MSKRITVFSCILLALLFTACGNKVEHYAVEAKTPSYETLQEMEDSCSVIVNVVRENQEIPVIKMENGNLVSGYTFSEVKVNKIYKDATNSVEEGDKLRILENEVFSEQENVVYHVAGYNMMEEGKDYLLFLNKKTYSDGNPYYVAVGVNFGTVSLEKDNRATIYFSRSGEQINNFEAMQPIWEEALKKYAE